MYRGTKPGALTPQSGQCIEVGPKGGLHGSNEITSVFGKPMPPTSKPNSGWKLVDATKHKHWHYIMSSLGFYDTNTIALDVPSIGTVR